MTVASKAGRLLPGVGLLVAIALLARVLRSIVPLGSALVVAIGIGVVVTNAVGVPAWADPGVETHGTWLELGIVLMGTTVGLEQVFSAGPRVLLLVVVTVGGTIVLVEVLSRGVFDVSTEVGSLLAVGSSICGVSAIVAVAQCIEARQREIAYAAATVVFFDAVTLVLYPAVGGLLGLSDVIFGVWAGLTMFSTGPVAAAGFAHSRAAGEWAVLVKLTRNALIGVVAIGYAGQYARRAGIDDPVDDKLAYLWQNFPKFVLGFVFMMGIGSAGVLSESQISTLDTASSWLFLVAFAGLGLGIDLREFRDMGLDPVSVVLTNLVFVSSVVLVTLLVLF